MEPIQLGSLELWPFGLCAAGGALAALLWACFRTRNADERRAVEVFALIALPLGFGLARLIHCLCNLDWIQDYFWETVLEFPGGGFLFYGALLGMIPALWAACRITRTSFAKMADLLAAPLLLFAAATVIGEGLAGAGYGWKVEDWFNPENSMSLAALEDASFFTRFPFAMTDPVYHYASWAVYLLIAAELLVCTALTAFDRPGRPGGTAVKALALYSAIRILYESLRQDDILKWGFVRVNQIFGGATLLVLTVLCGAAAARNADGKRISGRVTLSAVLFLLGLVLAGGMEFALEGKIGFLEWMTMDVCYTFTTLGCALLFASCEVLRRPAFGKER